MKIKPLLWALSPFAAGALLWLTLGAAADLENVYFPSVRVAHTNYVNELISSNGITLGGVRNTVWPAGGGGFVGAVSNNVATAGLLAVDSTKTNGIAATYAHITNALGFIPATNGVGGGSAPVGTVVNTVVTNALLGVDATKTNGIAANFGMVTNALGYGPLNKAGDTATGPIVIQQGSGSGLTITNSADVAALTINGFSGQSNTAVNINVVGVTNRSPVWINGSWSPQGDATNKAAPRVLISNGTGSLGGGYGTNWNQYGVALGILNTGAIWPGNMIQTFNEGDPATATFIVSVHGDITCRNFNQPAAATTVFDGYNSGVQTGGYSTKSANTYGWSSTTAYSGAQDLWLSRDGAATLQLGVDAATVTNQTLKAYDATGTDHNGASLIDAGGQPTGSGVPGDIIHQTALYTNSSGSTVRPYTERSRMVGRPSALTNSTATSFQRFSMATNTVAGIRLFCSVQAKDAAFAQQSISSAVSVDAVNVNGTITATVSSVDNTLAASTGTLTVSYTVADEGSNVLAVRCTATTSLTPTQLRIKWAITTINSDGAITVTPVQL